MAKWGGWTDKDGQYTMIDIQQDVDNKTIYETDEIDFEQDTMNNKIQWFQRQYNITNAIDNDKIRNKIKWQMTTTVTIFDNNSLL